MRLTTVGQQNTITCDNVGPITTAVWVWNVWPSRQNKTRQNKTLCTVLLHSPHCVWLGWFSKERKREERGRVACLVFLERNREEKIKKGGMQLVNSYWSCVYAKTKCYRYISTYHCIILYMKHMFSTGLIFIYFASSKKTIQVHDARHKNRITFKTRWKGGK